MYNYAMAVSVTMASVASDKDVLPHGAQNRRRLEKLGCHFLHSRAALMVTDRQKLFFLWGGGVPDQRFSLRYHFAVNIFMDDGYSEMNLNQSK